MTTATLMAGIPAENASLYLKIGLAAGDPAAWLSIDGTSTIIIRDIEKDRAQAVGAADEYASPGDFAPADGLDADRAIATAQSVAECFRQAGVARVQTDRSLPFVFAWQLMQLGIASILTRCWVFLTGESRTSHSKPRLRRLSR